MRFFLMSLLTALVAGAAAHAEDQTVLRLTYMVDDAPEHQVVVAGNSIDPNRRSTDDRFSILVNDSPLEGAEDFAAQLATQRRAFSYDSFTNGIDIQQPEVRCRMGGPSTGWVLETRYLTYRDHRIVDDEMRAVYSLADNCLFTTIIQPNDAGARVAAAMMLARLQTILELHGR